MCDCLPSGQRQGKDYEPVINGVVDQGDELLLTSKGDQQNLFLSAEGLVILRRRQHHGSLSFKPLFTKVAAERLLIPYQHVLSASSSGTSSTQVSVAFLRPATKQRKGKFVTLTGTTPSKLAEAQAWAEQLVSRAYPPSVKRRKSVYVLVNEFGGQGKGRKIWQELVLPVLEAAGCNVHVHFTGPANSPTNARTLALNADLSNVDVIACVSGDGIVHEVLNGLCSRKDAQEVLARIPLVPIPAGSGNALSESLLGPERVKDVETSTLAAIKGQPLAMDLLSVTQPGTEGRRFAFLSLSFGIMADLDLGTEHLRWMGDSRFIWGYVQGALKGATYDAEISIKVGSSGGDKASVAKSYNAWRAGEAAAKEGPSTSEAEAGTSGEGMPPLAFGSVHDTLPSAPPPAQSKKDYTDVIPTSLAPGWHHFRTSLFFLYAGKLPYVSADTLFFPAAAPDGLLDLMLCPPLPRVKALQAVDGAETGAVFHHDFIRYFKVECVRIVPSKAADGNMALDGEELKHEAIQIEVHRRAAKVLSLQGRWGGPERIEA